VNDDLFRAVLGECARLQELFFVARRAGRDDLAAEIRKAGELLSGVVGKLGRQLKAVP
jgi:hypothetical protein